MIIAYYSKTFAKSTEFKDVAYRKRYVAAVNWIAGIGLEVGHFKPFEKQRVSVPLKES